MYEEKRIPWSDTELDTPAMRATQARTDTPSVVKNEKTALAELTQKECKSTPWLVDYFQTSQSMMNWCLVGSSFIIWWLFARGFHWIGSDRSRLRKGRRYGRRLGWLMSMLLSIWSLVLSLPLCLYSLGASWLLARETLRCRVLNIKRGHENILWDASNGRWWACPFQCQYVAFSDCLIKLYCWFYVVEQTHIFLALGRAYVEAVDVTRTACSSSIDIRPKGISWGSFIADEYKQAT